MVSPFGTAGFEATAAVRVTIWLAWAGLGDEINAIAVEYEVLLSSTATEPSALCLVIWAFAATMSGLPSPFTSPTTTANPTKPPELYPTGGWNVPLPFPSSNCTLGASDPLTSVVTTTSSIPSPRKSPTATELGSQQPV